MIPGINASSHEFIPGVPTVTGGFLASDSTYYYRVFLGSGDLVVSNGELLVDVLIIGGGGPGGS